MEVLDHYQSFDQASHRLGSGTELRKAAESLVAALPNEPVVLLARTDAALMVCAAAAMVRDADTDVRRAFVGRSGWSAPEGSVLVEPVRPNAGLLVTLARVVGDDRVLVLEGVNATAALAA